MTETTAIPPAAHPSDPLFVRPREGRILAGVCAGIAERWNLDITLVRISAVVLTVLSGVGLVAYVAAWLLTPSADGPAPLAPDSELANRIRLHRGGWPRRIALLVLLVIGVGMLLSLGHTLWLGVPVGLVVVAGVLMLLVGTRLGRWAVAVVGALLIVALAALGVAGPHLGTRTYTVGSVSDLAHSYDYGAGTIRLDLSGIGSVSGDHTTRIHLGRGAVVVTLPQGVPVLVHAVAGVGSVTVNGHKVSGFDAAQTVPVGAAPQTASDRIVVDVTVGAGSVTVR